MKNMLLKIRNEMRRNNKDIQQLRSFKIINGKNGEGHLNNQSDKNLKLSNNKLCKTNGHRSIITYDDLDSEFYTLNEDNLCNYKQFEISASIIITMMQTNENINIFEQENKLINDTISELGESQNKEKNKLIRKINRFGK
jgi:hypothetical protein